MIGRARAVVSNAPAGRPTGRGLCPRTPRVFSAKRSGAVRMGNLVRGLWKLRAGVGNLALSEAGEELGFVVILEEGD